MRPTFIGIGAQKAGTTWIAACLAEHPEICMSYEKELYFFNSSLVFVNEPRNWNKGRHWYEQQFAHCNRSEVRGEFCVLYLPDKEAAANIYNFYPDVKIIVSLRSPVQRAISSFAHLKRMAVMHKDYPISPVPDDLFEASKLVPGIIEFGKYKTQLKRYLQLFRREQIKIVIYEDIALHPVKFIQDIYLFLGVDPNFVPSNVNQKRNPGSIPRIKLIEQGLHVGSKILSSLGMNGLVRWIKRKGIPDRIRIWNAKHDFIILSAEQYMVLQQLYKEDILFVEKLLGRTLDNWRYVPNTKFLK